ncbi:MAG: GNAT family N-acetyltransferase [Anaerolineales bacterium]
MAVPAVLSPRVAIEEDRSRLANLLHFETHVHRHLDWRRPLDWLGRSPYLVLEAGGRINAALACPPDPPEVAWIRLFATAARIGPADAWSLLWPQTVEDLQAQAVHYVAAIPLREWFRTILISADFSHAHNVVVLDWRPDQEPTPPALPSGHVLRSMKVEDIPRIAAVDRAAFAPLWQNSPQAVGRAFEQAGFATVVEGEGRIVAFQISTRGSRGLHLARLATHPDMQGKGLAQALMHDVQAHIIGRQESLLTVNTQDNNAPSLALYEKLGFHLTGEEFPVLQYALN